MDIERIHRSPGISQDQALDRHSEITHLRRLMAQAERRSTVNRAAFLHNQHMSEHLADYVDDQSGLGQPWTIGIKCIDNALPFAGVTVDDVHEVSGATYKDAVAASGYALALLWRLARSAPSAPILWCQTTKFQQEFGLIHGRGLEAFGFHADQFIFAEASHNRDVLWTLEEGARSKNLLAVVGEVDAVSFTQTRRLSLAAAKGGTPVVLLRPHNDLSSSAAETRWRIATAPGASDPFVRSVPGNPRWQVELTRCRGGRPGSWTVEWNNETHRFSLVEQFSARSPQMADAPVSTPALHLLQRRVASG